MVPHGPVTKSQSDIMPNVAHNGLANAFSQLINPLFAFLICCLPVAIYTLRAP